MKNLLNLALIAAAIFALAACSDDDPANPSPYADRTLFKSDYLIFPMEENVFYNDEDSSQWEKFTFKKKELDTVGMVIYSKLKYEHVSHYRPNQVDALDMTIWPDSAAVTTRLNGSQNYLYSFSYIDSAGAPAKVFCYADSLDYYKEITVYKESNGHYSDVPCYAYYLQKGFQTRLLTLFKKSDFRMIGQVEETSGVLNEKFRISRPGYKLKKP